MSALELESHDLLVKRAKRQRVFGAITTAFGLAVAGYGVATFGSLYGLLLVLIGMTGLVVGPMIFAASGRDPTSRSATPGRLRFDEVDGLLVSPGQRRIAMRDVEGAWIEDGYIGGALVIETKDGTTIAAQFADEERETAKRLLTALGADARLTVMLLPATETSARGLAGGCLVFALMMGGGPILLFLAALVRLMLGFDGGYVLLATVLPALISVLVMALAVRALSTTRLWIGADGVRIGRRFVPYGDLREVSVGDSGVVFETNQGDKIRVRCLSIMAVAVVARVRSALKRFREGGEEMDISVLDRARRSMATWRDDLAQLRQRSSYRKPALVKGDLLRVVENPHAPAERRAGAILALGEEVTTHERERVRIAYEGCAEPRARAVMEAAFEEELDELDRALRRLPPI